MSKAISRSSGNKELTSEVIELLSDNSGTIEVFSDSSSGNEEIFQKNRQKLNEEDLERLRPEKWLNDNLINYFGN